MRALSSYCGARALCVCCRHAKKDALAAIKDEIVSSSEVKDVLKKYRKELKKEWKTFNNGFGPMQVEGKEVVTMENFCSDMGQAVRRQPHCCARTQSPSMTFQCAHSHSSAPTLNPAHSALPERAVGGRRSDTDQSPLLSCGRRRV